MRKNLFVYLAIALATLQGYSQVGYTQVGSAIVYSDNYEGKSTASGEKYGYRKATCAHLNLPFGSLIKITNLENNVSAVIRVNDRGPFLPDKIVMVSKSVADKLGFKDYNSTSVKIEVVEENGNPVIMPQTVIDSNKNLVSNSEIVKVDTSKSNSIPQIEHSSWLFKTDIVEVNTTGFTIQIGNFKDLSNVMRAAAEAKVNLKKDVYCQIMNGSEKIYKLYVGLFSTKAEAERNRELVSKIYPGCFIIQINK